MSKKKDSEKRAHPRVPMMVKVVEPETGREEQFFSREVSRGGIFLETTKGYIIGKSLRLHFQVPGAIEVTVMARVARIAKITDGAKVEGVGLQFVDMDGRSEKLIAEYVDKLETIRKKLST